MLRGAEPMPAPATIVTLSLASWKDQGASWKYARSQHIDLLK